MVVVGKHTDKNTSTRIGNCCLLIIMTLLDHKLWMFEFSSIWVYFLSFEGTTLLNSLKWEIKWNHFKTDFEYDDSQNKQKTVKDKDKRCSYITFVYLSPLTFFVFSSIYTFS